MKKTIGIEAAADGKGVVVIIKNNVGEYGQTV